LIERKSPPPGGNHFLGSPQLQSPEEEGPKEAHPPGEVFILGVSQMKSQEKDDPSSSGLFKLGTP